MIGVIADPSEHVVISEFFELFKTPWEFYRDSRSYDVLLCAGKEPPVEALAKLVIIYHSQKLACDADNDPQALSEDHDHRLFCYNTVRIPIYGKSLTFSRTESIVLLDLKSQRPTAYLDRFSEKVVARIGYDLFGEVRTLLTVGQPVFNAGIPVVDLHIAFLRELIVTSGVPLLEIPPVPQGYRFIACLTHDIDHPSIRQHRFDHTMFGFLYRATLGSLFKVARRRAPLRHLLANWAAALKLPFVHLGFAKDFWREFEQYPKLEGGRRSSFFVIPFKGYPGCHNGRTAPIKRASSYGASDIAEPIQALRAAGCEIGLHGIDAWLDTSKARGELEQIRRVTGSRELGVRMHWLYFDQHSPTVLEQAGADYDSTVGYNEAIGYRAGTAQAYKPFEVTRLLELPLTIMDTALFFTRHLNLSPSQAKEQVVRIIDNAAQFGGCVTVNWHDRSIAPERLWGNFYRQLIEELNIQGAWFSTAAQAVTWFRKRRSAVFENVSWESGRLRGNISVNEYADVPDLQLRVHVRGEPYQDLPLPQNASMSFPIR
jgi:hypothetical protein